MFVIRGFQIKDSIQCAKIMNDCQKTMPEFDDEQRNFLLNKYTPEYVANEFPSHFVLVYEEDNQILGFGALLKSGEIRCVYVDPNQHRKGCGTALLRELKIEAKKCGHQEVFVKSYFGAESFYKKLGFSRISEGQVNRGDIVFPFVHMTEKI